MGKIPVYEQNQLASAAVGTPGADTSTSALFEGVSKVAQGVGGELAMLARQNQYELDRKRREQEVIDKAHKKTLDDIDKANQAIAIDAQYGDLEGKVQVDTKTDPTQTTAKFREQGMSLLDKHLETISDPELRNQVKLEGIKSLNSRMDRLNTWALGQRVENAKTGMESTRATLAIEAGKLATREDLQARFGDVDKLADSMVVVYGNEAGKVMRETKATMAEQYLNSRMLKPGGHALVRADIESGAFDDILPAKDRRELVNQAALLEKAETKEIEHQTAIESLGTRIDSAVQVVNTPDDSYNALANLQNSLQNTLNSELKKPREKQNISLVNQITSDLSTTRKKLQEFGTDRAAEARKKFDLVYKSDAAVNTRTNLLAKKAEIIQRIQDKVYQTPQQQFKAVDGLFQSVMKARKYGYLTPTEQGQWMSWLTKRKGSLASGEKGTSRKDREYLNAAKTFSGMVDKRSYVKMMSEYDRVYDAMENQYRRAHDGAEPSQAIISKMHHNALMHVYKEHK